MSIFKKRSTRSTAPDQPPAGIYAYRREAEGEKSRIHLRLDPDGHGTLIVNANRILHLNPTAAMMAYFLLESIPEETAIQRLRKTYRVGVETARQDMAAV